MFPAALLVDLKHHQNQAVLLKIRPSIRDEETRGQETRCPFTDTEAKSEVVPRIASSPSGRNGTFSPGTDEFGASKIEAGRIATRERRISNESRNPAALQSGRFGATALFSLTLQGLMRAMAELVSPRVGS